MKHINLSIVVPSFNEEAIIAKTLQLLAAYLKANPQLGPTEVIVVAAGTDNTAAIANEYADQFNAFKVITPAASAGKGRDVRLGFQVAEGAYQLFTDADLSTPLEYIAKAVSELVAGADVVIGKRNLFRIHQQKLRAFVSVVSNRLIRTLLLPGIYDSQCGFKAFRARIAKPLFTSDLRINGWAFDVEVLSRARRQKAKIVQLPIPEWQETRPDNLRNDRLARAIASTLGDILLLRFTLWIESLERRIFYIIAAAALLSGSFSLWIGMQQSVWLDEAYSIALARHSFTQIVHLTALDVHPPLYYFLLKIWIILFGASDLPLRSFSVICSLLAVGIGLLLIKRLWNARTALFVSPFALFAPFLLRYGFEIRMYALASLLGISATYVLAATLEMPSSRNRILMWALYILLVTAGMYTLYYTIFIWIAHFLWCLFANRTNDRWVKVFVQPWVAAYIVVALLFLPWLPEFLHQLHYVQHSFWIPPVDYRQVVTIGSLFFSYLTEWQLGTFGSLVFLTTLATVVYFVAKAHQLTDQQHRRYLKLLILYAVVPIVVMYLVSLPPLRPLFLERYISQTIIAAYLLVGLSITLVIQQRATLGRLLAAGFVFLVFVFGTITLYNVGNYNFEELYKPTARDIAVYINRHSSTSVAVVTDGPEPYLPMQYYLSNRDVRFYSMQPTLPYGGYAMLHDSSSRISDKSFFHERAFWLVYRGTAPRYITSERPLLSTQFGRYKVVLYD